MHEKVTIYVCDNNCLKQPLSFWFLGDNSCWGSWEVTVMEWMGRCHRSGLQGQRIRWTLLDKGCLARKKIRPTSLPFRVILYKRSSCKWKRTCTWHGTPEFPEILMFVCLQKRTPNNAVTWQRELYTLFWSPTKPVGLIQIQLHDIKTLFVPFWGQITKFYETQLPYYGTCIWHLGFISKCLE